MASFVRWGCGLWTEISSQLKYSTDWGTLLPEKPEATIEERIAAKKAELAAYVCYRRRWRGAVASKITRCCGIAYRQVESPDGWRRWLHEHHYSRDAKYNRRLGDIPEEMIVHAVAADRVHYSKQCMYRSSTCPPPCRCRCRCVPRGGDQLGSRHRAQCRRHIGSWVMLHLRETTTLCLHHHHHHFHPLVVDVAALETTGTASAHAAPCMLGPALQRCLPR